MINSGFIILRYVSKKGSILLVRAGLIAMAIFIFTLYESCTTISILNLEFIETEEILQLKNSEDLIGVEEVVDRDAVKNVQPRIVERNNKYSKQQYEKSIEKSKRKIMINNCPAQFAEPD